VTITLRKLHHQVRWNKAEKRTVEREKSLDQNGDSAADPTACLAPEPSPMEAVALVDEVQQVMRGLDPAERRMFELRLQGNNVEEIAAAVQCSVCTVRRFIKRVRQDLLKTNLASPGS
jgi:RNA polymerase sigma factor (sigma-70 family)